MPRAFILPLHAATIFTSAMLLFLVQPLIAKQILPWFGGSSAVWTMCLVFFQIVLLAGYAYSHWSTRWLRGRTQPVVHAVLLTVSLLSLPIIASERWTPTGVEEPTWRILGLLTATIGLPYFLLATTGPLVQTWFAREFPERKVYRLFALSNLASLVGLVAYPFAIEPWMTTTHQAYVWSAGYALFTVLCGAAALGASRRSEAHAGAPSSDPEPAAGKPSAEQVALWIALPAMSTWLLLAVTNHITQNVAAAPFLWLLPLTLYLATFIICFDHERWYRRWLFVAPALALFVACAVGLQDLNVTLNLRIAIPLYTGGLFVTCVFCHGELARLKPGPRDLTTYYLMIAAGGVLGGLAVGVGAPRLLDATYELGIGLTVTALLAVVVLRRLFVLVPLTALGVAAACGYYTHLQILQSRAGARVLERSFYGTLRTEDVGPTRQLINGVILHGEQFLADDRRRDPTTYYGPTSGIGIALRLTPAPGRRVGVIGLGTGSIAAYGQAGDMFRFYDLNPQVVDLARREFTYLADCPAAIEIAIGDARLNLEREPAQQFDLLAIDAFASDAIPVHLMTVEAMGVYLRHLKPGGVIAFHVTNRFFDLPPVVEQLANAYGLGSALIVDENPGGEWSKSDWMLVTRNTAWLFVVRAGLAQEAPTAIPGLRPWTDGYSNLLRILK